MKLIVSVAGEQIGVATLGRPGCYCVGRHTGSSLHLSHPTVSAQHATLEWDGSCVEVVDQTEGAATWLDGVSILGRHRWQPGKMLRMGAVLLELSDTDDADGPFGVTLTPTLGPLDEDPSLPRTVPVPALAPPERRRVLSSWAGWLAGTAASAAAFAAAWVALFW